MFFLERDIQKEKARDEGDVCKESKAVIRKNKVSNIFLLPTTVNIFPEKKEAEEEDKKVPSMRQSYNSQFNPTIARQNKLDPKEKYWLH